MTRLWWRMKPLSPFIKFIGFISGVLRLQMWLGGLLVIGGAGIFIIDQFNSIIVHGEDPSLDERVTKISITGLVLGLPMMLIHKKSQKIKAPYHILTVKKGSVFYHEPPQQMVIEN